MVQPSYDDILYVIQYAMEQNNATKYIITSGFALYLYGLRDTYDDIDIWWNSVKTARLNIHGVVLDAHPINIDSLQNVFKNMLQINKLNVMSLEDILNQKQYLYKMPNRPKTKKEKDLLDINKILKRIEENKNTQI